MDGRKWVMQQKLKRDTARFKKKLYLSNCTEFYETQIKTLSSQINEICAKKSIATTHQDNIENILKYYIAKLNLRMYPDSYKTNYGDENIKMNLFNLNSLSGFQKLKKDILNNDRKWLEDNIRDIVYYLEEIKKQKIKRQIKLDISDWESSQEKRKQLEEMKIIIPDLLHKVELYEKYLRENKFLYQQVLKQKKLLEKILENQKQLNEKLKQEEKNINLNENKNKKKKLEIDVEEKIYTNKNKKFENFRSLSEENFLFNYKSKNYDENKFENKKNKKKQNIHSLLFDNPKFIGYKSPISFLKNNKMKMKKLIKEHKPINPYNYLNIFTNNEKFDSISEFVDNFNSVNNKKISFYTINSDKTSTKINTISSNFSSKKKNQKIRLFSSQRLQKPNSNELISLRDYLINIIDQQRNIIKDLINKKAEEIRSNYQIKTFISDCINDINLEIYNIKENNKDNKDENIKEKIIKKYEYLLYFLTYIFDNCFSGVKNNIKKLINKSRNNNKINNNSKCDSYQKENIKLKQIFSSNNIRVVIIKYKFEKDNLL